MISSPKRRRPATSPKASWSLADRLPSGPRRQSRAFSAAWLAFTPPRAARSKRRQVQVFHPRNSPPACPSPTTSIRSGPTRNASWPKCRSNRSSRRSSSPIRTSSALTFKRPASAAPRCRAISACPKAPSPRACRQSSGCMGRASAVPPSPTPSRAPRPGCSPWISTPTASPTENPMSSTRN